MSRPGNADELRVHLDGRWAEIRDKARHLLDELAELGAPADEPYAGVWIEAQRVRTYEQLRVVAASGLPQLALPVEVGGGGDLGGAITGFEMLAMADLSLVVKTGVQYGLFGGAILHLGTTRHHQRYLPDAMSLALPGCFAMTETGHGSDVASLRTTATYDPATQEFVITTPDDDARKDYIGNAARDGRVAVVFAQLITGGKDQGVHAFMVPIRSPEGRPLPRVRIGDCGLKAGLGGVDNGRLWFDDVRIPRENLLNRYGDVAPDGSYSTPIASPNRRFFTMIGTLIQGRISIAAAGAAATKVALTIAIRYAGVRRQFAAPGSDGEVVLLDYLTHQRRLLPALARTYALHFAQEELVSRAHEAFTISPDDVEFEAEDWDVAQHKDELRRKVEARAAAIKAAATWHATATIQASREACGGAGYLAENQLPQLRADTDVFTTFEGDNTVLLQLVARNLLTAFRSHLGELDMLSTIRLVADTAAGTLVENAAAHKLVQRLRDVGPGRDEDTGPLDRAWQVAMFEWRERHLLETAARRLRAAGASKDAFAAYTATQPHLLHLANAYADRLLLEAFMAGIETAPESVRPLLDRTCDLFALSTIEADRAWFAEHGRLSAHRSKAVIAAVDARCRELRPQASLLVDGFGIPDACITAPIAQPR
ncbi:MAG TPA: acyl-CoA dehydrogenase [Jatrophihabitantaceae bacterium]